MDNKYSFEEIVRLGRAIYFNKYESELKSYEGQYGVIDVSSGGYTVNKDEWEAIEEARRKFGDQLFYIVRIGELNKATKFRIIYFLKLLYFL